MTVTHPHLLEKAIKAETTRLGRYLLDVSVRTFGDDIADYLHETTFNRIRADYKRRVQKKGRAA